MRHLLFCLLLCLCLLTPTANAQEPAAPPADPLVALDAAKLVLGAGRLEEARRQFAAISTAPLEPYIEEEVALQQLLLEGAFLDSTHFLLLQLQRQQLGQSEYAAWLHQQRHEHGYNFAQYARRYLELTEGGAYLTFVRFRLPHVSEEHLRDVELYSDVQMLAAAAKNWGEGREGLGKGLILAQARVAVALNAAVYYDLPEASTTVAAVSRRLTAGVPLSHAQVLDWIAATALRLKDAGNGLEQLSADADARLLALTAAQPADPWRQRAELRRNPPAPAAEPAAAKQAPAKKKTGTKRRKR